MPAVDDRSDLAFLRGGGAVGALTRTYDWAATPLGCPRTWPQSLRSALSICLNSPTVAAIHWGPELFLLYNDAYAPILAERHPVALGAQLCEVWPEVWDVLEPQLNRVLTTGEGFSVQHQALGLRRHGREEVTFWSYSFAPIRGENGTVAGIYCMATDITAQVEAEGRRDEAEAVVRAERDRTRRVLDGMGEGFGLLDRDFRVLDINAEALRLEGRAREAIVGRMYWDVWPGSEHSDLGRMLRRAMTERAAVDLDYCYIWPDGEDAWMEMRAYPADDGLALFWRDVTPRKRAEIALARNEAFSRGVLRASEDCIQVLSPDGLLERISEGGLRALALDDPLPLLGSQWAERFETDGILAAHAAVVDARAGRIARFEAGLKTQQGQLRWWDTVVSPIVGADGQAENLLALSRDVTDRRQAELTLRESEARLAFLDHLGAETAALADADAVLTRTTRLLGEHLNVSVCAYADMDEDQDGFTIRGDWAAPGATSIVGHYRLADFGKLAVTNLSAGLPLVVNDNLRELAPEEAATFQNIGIAATICMPLVKEGRLAALMAIHDRVPRTWTEAELGLLREVTARSWAHVERVAADAALRESEARFRNMADSTPVMIWVTDPTGLCTQLNSRWYEYTGQEPGVGEGYGWLDAVHPEDRPLAEQAFLAANAARHDYRVDFRLRRADGVYRWVIDAAAARFTAAGDFLGYVGSVIDIDERREAEARLALSEEQLRLATDAAEIGLWDLDPVADVLFWPPRVKAMFGVSADAPVTMIDFAAAVHPDDRDAVIAAFEAACDPARRARYDVEYRTIGKEDGVLRWVAAKGQGLFSDEGVCVRVIGTAIDITVRKADEVRLRELNERLELLVDERTAERDRMWEISPDLMVIIDFRGGVHRVNPACSAVLGYAPEEMVGHHVNEFVMPDDHPATVEAYELAAAGGRPSIVNRYRHKDGSTRWIAWVAAPGTNLTYATGRDVTAEMARDAELAAAEAARREADALYRAYFENAPEALFVVGIGTDGGFLVEEINPAHETGVGVKLEEVRGRRIEEVLPEAAAQRVLETYHHVVATNAIYQYREVFDLGGEPQHWDTSLVPLRNDGGQIVRLIGSSRNVTRQVVAEEALRQAQKMEAMGQLTGGVAHDFNNLLTPIVGALDMLERKGLGGEREQRLIAGAAQSADRAKTLVQRLLAFARRQPLQPVAVDVAQLVTGMADLITSTTGPQIRVAVDVEEDLPPAKADPNQLEMAVLNLAVNARDAMPDGGTLRISVAAVAVGRQHRSGLAPGRYLHLSVADTGQGMDEATRARAVEPFFSTKGIGKGTGLGLSMVHGLASQLGGAVTIRSTPGLGTNVELWLPQGGESAAIADVAASQDRSAHARGLVLLVDDEDLVRLSTADMLIELGYDVVEAVSAEEAMRLVNGGLIPDLVVTDHLMPGMSGTALAKQLQADRPALKALVVSGYAESDGIAPEVPRLTKPFRKMDLAASLAALG